MFWCAFTIVCVVIYVAYRFTPRKILEIDTDLGRWAAVTGATDGIGKAFAHELSKRGFNLVLLSRDLNKLKSTADEIEKEFKVSTKVIQADFTSADNEMYSKINDELNGLNIGVLVNNVGQFGPDEEFVTLSTDGGQFFRDILNCNVSSTIHMTRLVLPAMVAKGRGLILNVSSSISFLPSPLHAMSGGTKAFVTKFSYDLNLETAKKGVHVHALNTGLVATKMNRLHEESWAVPQPQDYAESALKETCWRQTCYGYFGHTLLLTCAFIVNTLFPELMAQYMYKTFMASKMKNN